MSAREYEAVTHCRKDSFTYLTWVGYYGGEESGIRLSKFKFSGGSKVCQTGPLVCPHLELGCSAFPSSHRFSSLLLQTSQQF